MRSIIVQWVQPSTRKEGYAPDHAKDSPTNISADFQGNPIRCDYTTHTKKRNMWAKLSYFKVACNKKILLPRPNESSNSRTQGSHGSITAYIYS